MPAVTVNSVKYNVAGSMRDQFYSITGSSGDTLVIGLNTVNMVEVQNGNPITSIAVAPGPFPGSSQLTFTSSGAFGPAKIEVKGT